MHKTTCAGDVTNSRRYARLFRRKASWQRTTARSNEVRLISPSARWQSGTVFLGSNGSFNQLVVSNGASVSDAFAITGYLGPASNNLALITGSGSVWSNAGPLYHGYIGAGNQLVVSNGGVLFNDVQAFSVMQLKRDPREEADADQKAAEFLNKSPYKGKLGNAGLFLKAVNQRAGQLV